MKRGLDQLMVDRERCRNIELVRSLTPRCEECGSKTDLLCVMKNRTTSEISSPPPKAKWSPQCVECEAPGIIPDEEVKHIEEVLHER